MRTRLSWLYHLCGWLAALSLLATLLIIVLNILGRHFGFYLRGADSYAGYSIAATAFLALAATLKKGDHIRVTLIFQRLTGRSRQMMELWCLAAGGLLSGYFSFFSWKMVWFSYVFHDISQGHDATPLWIPQIAMALGITALAIALADDFIATLRGKSAAAETGASVSFVE
ncbi:MAG: TRAP transporter small permease subunit [Smithellaceae bacterium]|nr:TRAP transporter small permease subunit [Smithellaceae bacterium]